MPKYETIFLLAALPLQVIVAPDRARAADVTIDARTAYQRMDGFGASQRVFDDPHVFDNFNPATARAATVLTVAQQDEVLDRLYLDLRLTRVRPASPETTPGVGIEPQNDNADPDVLDTDQFDFAWKNLDAHAELIARARQRGVTTWFLSPLNREVWMGTTTTDRPELVNRHEPPSRRGWAKNRDPASNARSAILSVRKAVRTRHHPMTIQPFEQESHG